MNPNRKASAQPLSPEMVARICQLRTTAAGETFGVATSTLARAIAGFKLAPGTRALIREALAKFGDVPCADVPRGTNEDGGAT